MLMSMYKATFNALAISLQCENTPYLGRCLGFSRQGLPALTYLLLSISTMSVLVLTGARSYLRQSATCE